MSKGTGSPAVLWVTLTMALAITAPVPQSPGKPNWVVTDVW
jgi:hypothetical protein